MRKALLATAAVAALVAGGNLTFAQSGHPGQGGAPSIGQGGSPGSAPPSGAQHEERGAVGQDRKGSRSETGAGQQRSGQAPGRERTGEIREQREPDAKAHEPGAKASEQRDRNGQSGERKERTGETRVQHQPDAKAHEPGAKASEQKDRNGQSGEHKERTGESREQREPDARASEQKDRNGQSGERKERAGETREQHAPDARAPEKRERTGESRDRREQPGDTREPRESSTDRRDVGAVHLTEERRAKIHDTIIHRHEGRVDSVNFSLSVGTRVPRTVHVYDMPEDVVTIVPEYRGFKYIIVHDELLVLDPETLEIVAVIPA
jgi:hypothetical protein